MKTAATIFIATGLMLRVVAVATAAQSAGAGSAQTTVKAPAPSDSAFTCTFTEKKSRGDEVCAYELNLPPAEQVGDDKKRTSVPPKVVPLRVDKHTEDDDSKQPCARTGCATVLTVRIVPKHAEDAAAAPADDISGARMRVTVRVKKAAPGARAGDSHPGASPSGASQPDASQREAQPLTATDGATRTTQLVLALGPNEPDGFDGEVEIAREDFGDKPVGIEMSIAHAPVRESPDRPGWFIPSLSEGHAERRWISPSQYRDLQRLGACTSARIGTCSVSPDIYTLVSNALGRLPAREFVLQDRANRSEPIVLFIGLGGGTAIALLDCRFRSDLEDFRSADGTIPDAAKRRQATCLLKADPWSISFERAPYFWAAYFEDVDTPFRTSIDVEFRDRAEHADYEEFDPASLAGRSVERGSTDGDTPVPVRVGFRRFRVREAPAYTKVGFSREGQGYGLRQWVRTYSQYGRRRWGFAGGVMVSAIPATLADISLRDVYADGATAPFAQEVVEDERNRLVFGFLAVRWYQWRDRAAEMTQVQQMWRHVFVPDVLLGVGVPGPIDAPMVGASWPLPILRDRVSFVVGGSYLREDAFTNGYRAGSRVPLGVGKNDVSEQRRKWSRSIGLAIDVVQWR